MQVLNQLTFAEGHIATGETPQIEWAAANSPMDGENECADLYLVKRKNKGVLLAAVDGLGHGSDACDASRKVVKCLKESVDNSLITLIHKCHEELRGSRGAVLSIARINSHKNELSWLSVGNVEGVLMSKRDTNGYGFKQLVLRSGVVGYKLPSLHVSVEKILVGDILFFTTDGVISDYIESLNYNRPLKETVNYAAQNYFKGSDDSLILAVRLRGFN